MKNYRRLWSSDSAARSVDFPRLKLSAVNRLDKSHSLPLLGTSRHRPSRCETHAEYVPLHWGIRLANLLYRLSRLNSRTRDSGVNRISVVRQPRSRTRLADFAKREANYASRPVNSRCRCPSSYHLVPHLPCLFYHRDLRSATVVCNQIFRTGRIEDAKRHSMYCISAKSKRLAELSSPFLLPRT